MRAISLADAKARLSELVEEAHAGGSVSITRRGKPVARLTGMRPPRKAVNIAMLKALTAGAPSGGQPAAELVRGMRDGDRY